MHTMDLHAQALSQDKRAAQTKIGQMILPKAALPRAKAG
jgi:hypothetical protein